MTFLNNLKNKFNNSVTKASVGATVMALPALSYAGDYDTLTGAVNFDDVKSAVLTVAAAVVGVYVLYRGAKMILSAIKSA